MRNPGPPHHVVDPDTVEAALLELDHPGVQQPLDGGPALSAQLPVTGGNTAPV